MAVPPSPFKRPFLWVVTMNGKQAFFHELRRVEVAVPAEGSGFGRGRHQQLETMLTLELLPHMTLTDIDLEEIERNLDAQTGQPSAQIGHTTRPYGDYKKEAKLSFARKVAQAIAEAYDEGAFDEVLLAAPPRLLGELRTHLSPELRNTMIGEIQSDLTHLKDRKLLSHIDDLLPLAFSELKSRFQ